MVAPQSMEPHYSWEGSAVIPQKVCGLCVPERAVCGHPSDKASCSSRPVGSDAGAREAVVTPQSMQPDQ